MPHKVVFTLHDILSINQVLMPLATWLDGGNLHIFLHKLQLFKYICTYCRLTQALDAVANIHFGLKKDQERKWSDLVCTGLVMTTVLVWTDIDSRGIEESRLHTALSLLLVSLNVKLRMTSTFPFLLLWIVCAQQLKVSLGLVRLQHVNMQTRSHCLTFTAK